MIQQHYLDRYNPQTVVPFSRVQDLLITVRQYSMLEKQNAPEKIKEAKESSNFDSGMFGTVLNVQRELTSAKEGLVTELVTLFFKLSNDERDNLDLITRQEMFEKIASDRKDVISFLSLSSMTGKMNTDTPSVSPTSLAETHTQSSSLPTQTPSQA